MINLTISTIIAITNIIIIISSSIIMTYYFVSLLAARVLRVAPVDVPDELHLEVHPVLRERARGPYTCVCVCVRICLSIYLSIYLYIYIYIYICLHTYTYTYTYTPRPQDILMVRAMRYPASEPCDAAEEGGPEVGRSGQRKGKCS